MSYLTRFGSSALRHAWLAFICCVSILTSATIYFSFLQDPEMRWGSLDHDRNAHFLSALKIATDLRAADLPTLVRDVEKIRTWPPLHAIAVGGFAALSGTDYRLAVLPNLLSWGIGAVFIYLLGVELSKQRSVVAGLVSLGFYLGSSSHRVFATDFMLESIGSTLSLCSLYFYVKVQQTRSNTIALAICLSLLFFTKYNYWLLVVLAIALVEIYRCKERLTTIEYASLLSSIRSWCFDQRRIVSNYLLLASVVALAFKVASERFHFWPFGETNAGSKHENAIHLVYLFLILRIASQWKSELERIWHRQSHASKAFCLWHVLPIAIWFSLPKRLGYFIWYIGPFNGTNTHDRTLSKSFEFYWWAASEFYFAHAWLLPASAILALLSMIGIKFLRRETAVVFVFAAISILLTLNHGNQKVRFLHTWIPSIWLLAGLGVGCIEQVYMDFARSINATVSRHVSLIGQAVCLAWLLWCANFIDVGKSPESGHFRSISSLSLPDNYLPTLANRQKVALVGSLPIEYFAEWSYIAAYPRQQRPWTTANMRWFHMDRVQNKEKFNRWLLQYRPEVIVFIDVLESSSLGFPDFEQFRQFRELLTEQHDYQLTDSKFLELQACHISTWELSKHSTSHSLDVETLLSDRRWYQ